MKILITGVAGFIASNFSKEFRKQFPDAEIVGIDNFATGRRDAVPQNITFYENSVDDVKALQKIFTNHKIEYVFHFAAIPRVSYSVKFPLETTHNNVCGIVALLDQSAKFGVKRLIFSSSSSVYGGAKILPSCESENLPDPKSPYAAQKYAGEIYCKIWSNLYGLDAVSLRYFNVFGPGQYGDSAYSTVVSAWLEALYFPGDKKPFLEGDGEQSRDFCYVDNVISANILAMQCKEPLRGNVFNVAHGERTSLNEVKNLIEKYTGRNLLLETREPRLGDVLHTHADISKAKELLNYKPKFSFEDGLKKTIEWFDYRIKK